MSNPNILRLASDVSHRVSIRDLRTTHLHFDLHKDASGPLNAEVATEVASAAKADYLVYELRFTMELSGLTEDTQTEVEGATRTEERVLTGSVHLTLLYDITEEGFQPDEDQQDAFGRLSVIHTAYPYLRETLHTITVRAGLPPLVLETLLTPPLPGHSGD